MGGGGGMIADNHEDKDAEKDVDENKDLMKNDSVSRCHILTCLLLNYPPP